ncbi:MAG: S-layer homology domain-containing protein [Carboxydocellales bacterium]
MNWVACPSLGLGNNDRNESIITSSDAQASGSISYYDFTEKSQQIVEGKKAIILNLSESLLPDTKYKVVISKDLSSNNGIKLGQDVLVYFKTGDAVTSGNDHTGSVTMPAGQDVTISTSQLDKQTVLTAPEQVTNTQIYEFDAQIGSQQTHTFQQAITITLPIPQGLTDSAKLGVYYLNETSGKWEYVGGRIIDGKLVFTTSHFSKYMVAESQKTFADISSHWAKEVIEVMAALQIVSGVSTTKFAPETNVTRAEFASLLSRVLKLSDTAASNTFGDVVAGAWYAGDVLKSAKAGIIKGEKGKFRPNDRITRQEMAVMIMRAYAYAGGKVDETTELKFLDKAAISSWASDNVKEAQATVMLKNLMDKLGL